MDMDLLRVLTADQVNNDKHSFNVGDTVRVHFKIIEGKTERVQAYEGLVLCFKKSGVGRTFTVRKTSYGVGVERVFPFHSPRVQKVEVLRPGKVRRAKLYYIREKVGKAAKIKELIRSHKADGSETPAAAK
jgi:large subunit ribosomal protein L19